MTARIFLKLLLAVVFLLCVALIAVDFFASRVAESTYLNNLTREMADKGRMFTLSFGDFASVDQRRLKALAQAAGARVTVIAQDGRVLADSEADTAHMENHRNRPEVMEALRGGVGSSIRHSATIGVNFLYVAVPNPAGALRLAVPLSRIEAQVASIRRKILASAALAFLPAIGIAAFLARRTSRQFASVMQYAGELAKGNFRARLGPAKDREFGLLVQKLNETAEKLEKTVQQLHAEHAQLESLERIRKDFVINVSHELRTPLASIQGYAETLMDGAIHDPAHNMRFLGIIRHNAERLARLTADLLTLSRIELKRQDFHFDYFPLGELLTDAVETLRPIAEKKNITISVEPPASDLEVFCDSEAVSQVLSNLLDNAVKYTPEGGTIVVGGRAADSTAEVYVRDSGAGIPEEDLPRLFERFYRVDKARSRELGGTGLGLSIVKHLVAAHHGQVRVDSEIGRGSTFIFTLPLEAFELHSQFTQS